MTFFYRNFSEQVSLSQKEAENTAKGFFHKFRGGLCQAILREALLWVMDTVTGFAKSYHYTNERLFEVLGVTHPV